MTNNLTPDGDLVLEKLGINPHNLRVNFPTREQRLHYRAVVQWLTDYKPNSDATNLEKVQGYLEAFHHLGNVEDWERAREILFIRLDTPTNESLPDQLLTWGYYREPNQHLTRLIGKLNQSCDVICWNGVGVALLFFRRI
ncbi:MAG: hypothetical protein U7123_23105 [Potamolinea sp.]